MHVIATAGHVDHGKSTLVLTLTGTDPDRWTEEKVRGLTIDLGFAHRTLPSGADVSFVDVPGHIRFLKNMLAGVGGVDACLFVVAATEGWKPQSEEHLRILELLGIRHGVIALTKVGLVDAEWAELARLDVEDHVAGTFLHDAPIVAVDAPTGRGIDDLVLALEALVAATPAAVDRGRARLWIDRVFSAKGAGTVVTGTLTGGTLKVDATVDIVRAGSTSGNHSALTARIRSLQTHGRSVAAVGPGNRVAVNLAGVSHDDLARGDALVEPSRWHRTTRVDASLTTLTAINHEVSRRGAYACYIGSGEHHVKVRILGATGIGPGETGLIRLHLRNPLPLVPGDRFILRDDGREETVGGGEVLDVDPRRPASRAVPDRSPERVVHERGVVALDLLDRLIGQPWTGPVIGGRWAITLSDLDALRSSLFARVEGAGTHGLDVAALSDAHRAVLEALANAPTETGNVIAIDGGRATIGVAHDALADHPFVGALAAGRFSPPDPTGVDRGVLRELVRKGYVVEQDGVYFAPSAVEAACMLLAELLEGTDGVTVADIRDVLGNTRKHVLPLLAHLDATGRTRRRGDLRIAGPRLLPGGAR